MFETKVHSISIANNGLSFYLFPFCCKFQPSTREAICNTVEPEKVRQRDVGLMTSLESEPLPLAKPRAEKKKPKGKNIAVNTEKVHQLTVALSTNVSTKWKPGVGPSEARLGSS
jgi:hypothetical protein